MKRAIDKMLLIASIGFVLSLVPHYALAADNGCDKAKQAQSAPQLAGGAPQSLINEAQQASGAPQSLINEAQQASGAPQSLINESQLAKGAPQTAGVQNPADCK